MLELVITERLGEIVVLDLVELQFDEDQLARDFGELGNRIPVELRPRLIGLIPGFMSPTSSLNTTLALTIIVWVTHHFVGIREHGLSYYKHFMGPMWWLVPLMLPIEIISNLARLISLSIRLFGNIMAKETLLGILFMLAGAFFAPLPIMLLGVLVSLVQAMVFVLLAVVYFSQAQELAH